MHRTLFSLPSLVPMLFLAACGRGPDDGLDQIRVASASLENVDLTSLAVIVGGQGGSGDLVVTDDFGTTHVWPVALAGPELGAALEINIVELGPGDAPFDLSEADPDLTAADLVGRYNGTGAGLTVGIGVDDHSLQNRNGVKLDKGYFAVGIAFFVGFEWLNVRIADD